jgi:hypothetical protein
VVMVLYYVPLPAPGLVDFSERALYC